MSRAVLHSRSHVAFLISQLGLDEFEHGDRDGGLLLFAVASALAEGRTSSLWESVCRYEIQRHAKEGVTR